MKTITIKGLTIQADYIGDRDAQAEARALIRKLNEDMGSKYKEGPQIMRDLDKLEVVVNDDMAE